MEQPVEVDVDPGPFVHVMVDAPIEPVIGVAREAVGITTPYRVCAYCGRDDVVNKTRGCVSGGRAIFKGGGALRMAIEVRGVEIDDAFFDALASGAKL